MSDSARNAIVWVAVATPFALGLWVYGRWRAGDLQPTREALVIAGTTASSLMLIAIFAARSEIAALLIPPVGLLVGGLWTWMNQPRDSLGRWVAILAMVAGGASLLLGAGRLLLG